MSNKSQTKKGDWRKTFFIGSQDIVNDGWPKLGFQLSNEDFVSIAMLKNQPLSLQKLCSKHSSVIYSSTNTSE